MLSNSYDPDRGKRVLLYSRVSTENQAREGSSMDTQDGQLRQYAESRGWNVLDVIRDAGESGAKFDRPGIRRLIEWVGRGGVDLLVVSKVDRFGRDTLEGLRLFREVLEKNGVHIVSLDGVDSRTPQGQFMLELMLAVARQERQRILERCRGGIEAALRDGRWPGGKQPFGYDYNKTSKKLEVIEQEASVVRRVFGWYVEEGLSTHKIAHRLFGLGIRTRKTIKNPLGTHPGPTWISRILSSAAYTGELSHTKNGETFRISLPAVVTKELFAAAQAKLAAGLSKSKRCLKREILAAHYVYCAECEARGRGKLRMFVSKRRFTCGTQLPSVRNRPDQRLYRHDHCGNNSVPIERLDGVLWAHISRLFKDPRWRMDILFDASSEARRKLDDVQSQVGDLEERLAKNLKEQERQAELFLSGAFSQDVLKSLGDRLKAERAAVEGELAKVNKLYQEAAAAKTATRASIKIRVHKLDELSFEARRSLLELLFAGPGDGLYISKGGGVEVRARWTVERVEQFLGSYKDENDPETQAATDLKSHLCYFK